MVTVAWRRGVPLVFHVHDQRRSCWWRACVASGLWVTMATVDIYVLHFKKKSLPGCVVLNGRLRKKYVRNLSKLVCNMALHKHSFCSMQ